MFAVLHIADFALHAVLRTGPDATDRPAALFAAQQKKSLVLAATASARARGIEPGMTAPQAAARCPGLLIRTPCAAAEAEARAALLAVAFTLSPLVEETSPGVCTADLKGHGASSVVGPPAGRAARPPAGPTTEQDPLPDDIDLRPRPTPPAPLLHSATAAINALAQLGLPATAGLGRTPLLALYAAQAAAVPTTAPATPEAAPLFLLGEPEDDSDPAPPPNIVPFSPAPAGVRLVTDEASFLAPLPLAVAAPPPELAAVFTSWGVRTLGDLTALPRDELIRRFGHAGLGLWQRATGGEVRPLHPAVPPQRFAAAMEFEDALETLEPLLFILRRLLDRLTLELRAAQLVAGEIELTLRLADDSRHTRAFRLPEPTADGELLFRALHTHLETLQTAAAITAVDLHIAPVRPLVRQHGLFDTGLRDPHGFAETLARVAALVAEGRVGTPRLADTHRPDAVQLAPPPAVVPPPAPPPVHPELGPPLRRFRPPLPANLEFTPHERQPTYVWTAEFHGAIRHIRGPWRSNGDWWEQGRRWSRMEWDIALADGGLYRLLRLGEAYFIEGEYD